jgi:hypothetical protein
LRAADPADNQQLLANSQTSQGFLHKFWSPNCQSAALNDLPDCDAEVLTSGVGCGRGPNRDLDTCRHARGRWDPLGWQAREHLDAWRGVPHGISAVFSFRAMVCRVGPSGWRRHQTRIRRGDMCQIIIAFSSDTTYPRLPFLVNMTTR